MSRLLLNNSFAKGVGMKRLVATLALAGSALLVAPSIAGANPYGPDGPSVATSTPTVVSGDEFTITVNGCELGSTWTFTFGDQTTTDTCQTAMMGFRIAQTAGIASATFTAPTAPGTYTGTATSGTTTLTFSVTIQGAGAPVDAGAPLPNTGSDNTASTLAIAAALVAVGLCLVAVAYMRSRRPPATAI